MSTLRITSDSSLSTRYYSGSDAACNKIATALCATLLIQTSPYSSDGVHSAGSLALLQVADLANDDIHLIMIGGNDAYGGGAWQQDWLDNVSDMIDLAQSAGTPVIMVCSQLPQKVEAVTYDLHEAMRSLRLLCADKGVAYVPVWERFVWESGKMLNQTSVTPLFRPDPDTGHPLIAGNTIIAAEVFSVFDGLTIPAPAGAVWHSTTPGTNLIYSNARLGLVQPANETGGSAIGTVGKSSGKWYFEAAQSVSASAYGAMIGITRGGYSKITSLTTTGADDYWYDSTGRKNTNGSPAEASGLTTWNTVGNTVGVLLDIDGGTVDFIDKNGAAITGFSIPAGTYYPIAGHLSGAKAGNKIIANFAGPFVHAVPSGFAPFV